MRQGRARSREKRRLPITVIDSITRRLGHEIFRAFHQAGTQKVAAAVGGANVLDRQNRAARLQAAAAYRIRLQPTATRSTSHR